MEVSERDGSGEPRELAKPDCNFLKCLSLKTERRSSATHATRRAMPRSQAERGQVLRLATRVARRTYRRSNRDQRRSKRTRYTNEAARRSRASVSPAGEREPLRSSWCPCSARKVYGVVFACVVCGSVVRYDHRSLDLRI